MSKFILVLKYINNGSTILKYYIIIMYISVVVKTNIEKECREKC